MLAKGESVGAKRLEACATGTVAMRLERYAIPPLAQDSVAARIRADVILQRARLGGEVGEQAYPLSRGGGLRTDEHAALFAMVRRDRRSTS